MSQTRTATTLEEGEGTSHIPPKLTLLERLRIWIKIPIILTILSRNFIRQLILRRDFSRLGFTRALTVAAGQAATSVLSVREMKSLTRPTGHTASVYCGTHNVSLDSVVIRSDPFPPARLHFIDNAPTSTTAPQKRILLYFHGGAFIFPAQPSQFAFAHLAAKTASAHLAMLEYSLAPEVQYPAQLAQAVAAIQYLIDDRGYSLDSIMIGGDSAGGRIALGILSHLSQPHPRIPSLRNSSSNSNTDSVTDTKVSRLKAALLISPGCNKGIVTESMRRNLKYDVLSSAMLGVSSRAVGAVAGEVWAQPLDGDENHWSNVRADKVLITAGAREVSYDALMELSTLMHASPDPEKVDKVTLVIGDEEIHEQPVMDASAGVWNGQGIAAVLKWLRKL